MRNLTLSSVILHIYSKLPHHITNLLITYSSTSQILSSNRDRRGRKRERLFHSLIFFDSLKCNLNQVHCNWSNQRVNTFQFSSVQSLSHVQLCDPMNHSTPGLPVHHQLPEFTQTHVLQISDAFQPSHPRSSPSPTAPNPSQHQSLFQWVNSLHEVAKVLELQLQHHSFQRNPRADLLQKGLVGSPCSPRDSQESSPTKQQ